MTVKKLIEKVSPKVSSRRERMTYWMIVLGFVMFLIATLTKVNMGETIGMYTAIAAVAAWYLQKETEKKSEEPM